MSKIVGRLARVRDFQAWVRRSTTRRSVVRFSSLADAVVGGNPMFDQRPMKPLSTGENGGDSNRKQTSDSEESWASRHWSKISVIALITSVGLLYNYFQGYRNRSAEEEKVVKSQAIEPLEVNEIRMASKGLTSDVFKQISIGLLREHPHGKCTYREFVSFMLGVLESQGVALKGMHLLDRVVESHIASVIAGEAMRQNGEETSSGLTGVTARSAAEHYFPIGYFLTALNLALAEPAPERVETLFTAAFAAEKGARELESRSDVVELPERKSVAPLPTEAFVSSSTWEGRKEGYYFGTGKDGTGYYRDEVGYEILKEKINDDYKRRVQELRAEYNRGDVISVEAATAALSYLMDTCQVPGEKQVITTGKKYPAETFRKTTSDELMTRGRKGLGATPSGTHVDSEFTRAEFTALLLGPEVCAWGECFRRR